MVEMPEGSIATPLLKTYTDDRITYWIFKIKGDKLWKPKPNQ
jgi:hypothetical protein